MTIQDDEIIEEIRRHRYAHAASFNFDVDRIVEDIQRQERESGEEYVCRPPRKPWVPPKQASA